MYKKDFIDTEIQKLAEALAKIIGLKNDGNVDEAFNLANQALNDQFELKREDLEQKDLESFQLWIKEQNYSAEKLNLLASLLFEAIYPFTDTPEIEAVVHKTAFVLNTLEVDYHQQSYENLHRRDIIDKFLSNRQYE